MNVGIDDAGQGLCLAMEDAVVLAWHLRRQGFTPQALRRSGMLIHQKATTAPGRSAQALHKPDTWVIVFHHWHTSRVQQNCLCVLATNCVFWPQCRQLWAFTEMMQAGMGCMHNVASAKAQMQMQMQLQRRKGKANANAVRAAMSKRGCPV